MRVVQAVDAARRRKTDAIEAKDQSAFGELIDKTSLLDGWEGSWAQMLLELSLRRVRTEVDPKTDAAFEAVALDNEAVVDAAARLGKTPNAVAVAKHGVLSRLGKLHDELEVI